MLSDGRIIAPAVVDGQSDWLLLGTAQRLDLVIDIGYATKQGWPYERRSPSWGISPIIDVFTLGRARAHDEVVVTGTAEEAKTVYRTAGTLGVQYANHATLALDPVDVAVGIADRWDVARALPPDAHRVALLESTLDRLPVTLDLVDDDAPERQPRFLIDTARPSSVISLTYVDRAWSGVRQRRGARRAQSHGGKVEVSLRLPGGDLVSCDMFVAPEIAPRYVSDLGTHVDGYLGLDFLYRWLPIFDFPKAALWLVPFDSSGAAARSSGAQPSDAAEGG